MTKYAHWAEKIDSYEKFEAARNKGIKTIDHEIWLSAPYNSGANYDERHYWFNLREQAREACGIYPEPTSVLTSLRTYHAALGQYFPHVSKEDPTMIAYTPDRTAGLADKQIRSTLGRFLRKYLLCPSDDWVAKMEAQHRADLNGEFLIAKTLEEIEEVYTKMAGDGGCMRHTKGSFGTKYHPSAVYTGPGLAVAYLRNAAGQINARSVIYVNPDKPDDKRYVRIYGDASLASKLKRQGFRCAALEGVKLAKLTAGPKKGANSYMMPYLDGPGGNRGTGKDCEAPYVVWPKGTDYFMPISEQSAGKLMNLGLPVYGARSTSGYIEAYEADMSALTGKCHFTGVDIDLLSGATAHTVLLDDGTIVMAVKLPDEYEEYYLRRYGSSRWNYLYCKEATYRKLGFNGYYPDDATLKYNGYKLLSETLYPDQSLASRVVSKDSATTVTIEGVSHVVRSTDAYTKVVFDQMQGSNFVYTNSRIFKTEAAELKKQGWISTAPISSYKALTTKDNPGLVKLPNGKMALRNLHAIVPLAEGGWTSERTAKAVSVMGLTLYTTLEDVFELPLKREYFKYTSFHRDFSKPDNIQASKNSLASHIVRSSGMNCRAIVQNEGDATLRIANSYSTNSFENLIRAANTVLGKTDDQLREVIGYAPKAVRFWARCVLMIEQILQDRIAEDKYRDAEANAVDHSLTPEEVLAQAARDVRNHPKPAPEPVNGRVDADTLLKWARNASTSTGSGVYISNAVVRTTSSTPSY